MDAAQEEGALDRDDDDYIDRGEFSNIDFRIYGEFTDSGEEDESSEEEEEKFTHFNVEEAS
jgi:hypothetical protein